MGYTAMTVAPDGPNLKISVTGATTPEYIPLDKVVGVVGSYVDFRRIGDTTQAIGSGLDDITTGGTPTDVYGVTYELVIVSAATPDTFKWRSKQGNVWSDYSSAANITGSAQTLENGITVTFGATTGHTANDAWEFTVQEKSAVSDGENYAYTQGLRVYIKTDDGRNDLDFDIQQVTNQATWLATEAGLAVAVNDIQKWIP